MKSVPTTSLPNPNQGLTLLAIDPDVKLSGWAYYIGMRLMACGVTNNNSNPEGLLNVDLAIVEIPQKYSTRNSKQRIDPNDLIKIAACGGQLAGRLHAASVEYVLPRTWKGQEPKGINHQRMRDRFSELGDWDSLMALKQAESSLTAEQVLEAFDAASLGQWRARRAQRCLPTRLAF